MLFNLSCVIWLVDVVGLSFEIRSGNIMKAKNQNKCSEAAWGKADDAGVHDGLAWKLILTDSCET